MDCGFAWQKAVSRFWVVMLILFTLFAFIICDSILVTQLKVCPSLCENYLKIYNSP